RELERGGGLADTTLLVAHGQDAGAGVGHGHLRRRSGAGAHTLTRARGGGAPARVRGVSRGGDPAGVGNSAAGRDRDTGTVTGGEPWRPDLDREAERVIERERTSFRRLFTLLHDLLESGEDAGCWDLDAAAAEPSRAAGAG